MGQAYITRRGGVAEKALHTEIFLWTRTWTCPKGVTSVTARLFGAGGEGTNYGGGGGGHMAYGTLAVSPGTSYAITVGATSSAPTSFGTLLTASGGSIGGANIYGGGGNGGTGGGAAQVGKGGNGSYGGGGGGAQLYGGGNGGTYGGGGGCYGYSTNVPGTGGTYGGDGATHNNAGSPGTNTTGMALDFTGTGSGGAAGTGAGGGGGGYGGNGGKGGDTSGSSYNLYGGGGGGGGYGGNGGNGSNSTSQSTNGYSYGGGGGGYGSNGENGILADTYANGQAGGGGGYGKGTIACGGSSLYGVLHNNRRTWGQGVIIIQYNL